MSFSPFTNDYNRNKTEDDHMDTFMTSVNLTIQVMKFKSTKLLVGIGPSIWVSEGREIFFLPCKGRTQKYVSTLYMFTTYLLRTR